jgi:hypothetical protein
LNAQHCLTVFQCIEPSVKGVGGLNDVHNFIVSYLIHLQAHGKPVWVVHTARRARSQSLANKRGQVLHSSIA